MSDSGEGLVDASTRLAERMEEMEEDRRRARITGPRIDPEKAREFLKKAGYELVGNKLHYPNGVKETLQPE